MSATVQLARGIARRYFEKRGNHSEVHLKEYDLMILLGVAINRGRELGPEPESEYPEDDAQADAADDAFTSAYEDGE